MSKTIVLGENTEFEKRIELKPLRGKEARYKMPKILAFLAKMRNMQDSEDQFDSVVNLMELLWSDTEFEESILPFVLGVDSKELESYGNMDLLTAFGEAANYLVESTFSRKEVSAALGKSEDEAQKEAQ